MANFADPDGNELMLHNRYAPPDVSPACCSSASTSSSCVFGDAFGITWATRPSGSMMNVARWAPQ